jgi:hypothetical protein
MQERFGNVSVASREKMEKSGEASPDARTGDPKAELRLAPEGS